MTVVLTHLYKLLSFFPSIIVEVVKLIDLPPVNVWMHMKYCMSHCERSRNATVCSFLSSVVGYADAAVVKMDDEWRMPSI